MNTVASAWTAWQESTWLTWAWVGWIAAFIVLETVALVQEPKWTLTWHLRPLFTEHALTWFLALGLWLWLGLHFLLPAWEDRLLELLVR